MPNRKRTKIRRWIFNHIPRWMRKYNFELFAGLLCIFAGVPLMLGRVDPTSLEALLPHTLVVIWGTILTIGPMGMIAGIIGANRSSQLEDQIFWRRIEAWGLSSLAYATYIYVGALLLYSGQEAWVASMLVLSFGFTCHVREIDLQLRITDVLTEAGVR